MTPEGVYPAKIEDAWVETLDKGGMLLCFNTALTSPDGERIEECAKHATFGKGLGSTKAVCKLLDIEFPDGLAEIERCVGTECDVRIKHKVGEKHTFLNAYIVTARQAERASKDEIAAGVAKMRAELDSDDALPF